MRLAALRKHRRNSHRRNSHRHRRAAAASLTAVGVLALAGVWHANATEVAAPLWQADPAKGVAVFEGVEKKPGEVSVVDDPKGAYGKTYRLYTSGEKVSPQDRVRVETRGHKRPDGSRLRFEEGDTVYVGWRSMWDPLPTKSGDWVALWQLKDYGSGAATPPLSLRARGDGTVDLEYCDPDMKTTRLWDTPLRTGEWHHFVVGITVSENPDKGSVKFWYDGEPQQLKGAGTFKGATLRADWVTDKWGVYRSDGVKGEATAYLNGAKVGRSYEEVAP